MNKRQEKKDYNKWITSMQYGTESYREQRLMRRKLQEEEVRDHGVIPKRRWRTIYSRATRL